MKFKIPQFNSKIIFLSILAFFIVTISIRFFTLLSFRDSSVVLEKGDLITLKASNSLSQSFFANRGNLSKIEFILRTPTPKPEDVKIKLADENCEKTIRKGTLSVPFLNSDNLFEFTFDKIPNSNGQKYCIIATYKPKDAAAKSMRFFSMNSNDQQIKNISTGETFDGKTLSIRGVYKNNHIWQDATELNKRISQYKPWFLKHYYLAAISSLFIVLSIGLVVILILL